MLFSSFQRPLSTFKRPLLTCALALGLAAAGPLAGTENSLWGSHAQAQSIPPGAGSLGIPQQQQVPEIPQISLSEESVGRLIESMPIFKARMDALEEEHEDIRAQASAEALLDLSGYPAVLGELDDLADEHGFENFETWQKGMISTFLAHSIVKQEQESGKTMQQQMDEALQNIRNDNSIPADQKEMIIRMMQSQLAPLMALQPLPGNREAVTPYMAELDKLAEELENEQN